MRRIRSIVRRVPLATEATIALTLASVRLARSPPAKTARLLGAPRAVGSSLPSATPFSAEALRVGRAVERVAQAVPWHPVCLPRALAATWMLRRRGIHSEAHLGLLSTEPPSAHAWVTVGGAVVQGGPVDAVTEIAFFV